jgi:outer membrane protein OmpA-like peptidoglycan-associated protein
MVSPVPSNQRTSAVPWLAFHEITAGADAMHVTPTSTTVSALALMLLASTTGCASLSNAEKGGLIGIATGGAAGAAVGSKNGSTTRGAIIGAAVGGAAGAIIGARMDRQARKLEQTIAGATVERVGEGIHVTFDSGILFDFDSDILRPEARTNLRELARSLQEYPGSDLLIAGHTDDIGTSSYNRDLSRRRAVAAVDYLVAQGASRREIDLRGLGEDEPVAPNETEYGRQRNRRVEVAIFAGEELRQQALRSAGGYE